MNNDSENTSSPTPEKAILNPVDVLRHHISELLATVSGIESSRIFPALAWTNTLDKGDLVLAVPRLQVKGANPAHTASEWAEKASHSPLLTHFHQGCTSLT